MYGFTYIQSFSSGLLQLSYEVRISVIGTLIFTAGITLGLFIAVLIIDLNGWVGPNYYVQVPNREDVDQLMSYAEPVDDKSDRYFTMGTNWIIIKDFPENIQNHRYIFSEESTKLWGYSPSMTKPDEVSQ